MKKRVIILLTMVMIIAAVSGKSSIELQRVDVFGQYPIKSRSELIGDAEVILRGTVSKIYPARWSNPGFKKGERIRNIIQTDIGIKVEEVFKGTPYNKSHVKVRIEEGKVGKTVMISHGFPDFMMGEETILFLSPDDSDVVNPQENYYVLVGAYNGKYNLQSQKDNDMLYSTVLKNEIISLSTFKLEVKGVLDNLRVNPVQKLSKEEIRQLNEKVFEK